MLRKFISYGLVFIGLISFLIISLFLTIKIIFPAQELKGIAERKLGEVLKKDVTIETVQFRPLRGIALENIVISDKNHVFFSVKKISLDYDLKQLLKKKIVITRVRISKPAINLNYLNNEWNVPLLNQDAQIKDSSKPPISKGSGTLSLPVLPFAIDVHELNITDISLSLNYNNNIIAELSGINLLLKGKISSTTFNIDSIITSSPDSSLFFQQAFPEKIKFRSSLNTKLYFSPQSLNNIPIRGEVKFNNISAFFRKDLELNDFSIALDSILNLTEEKIKLNNLNFDSSNFLNLNIKGEINRFLKQPKFDISLTNSTLMLKNLNHYLSPFIQGLNFDGLCGINNIHIIGSLGNTNSLEADVQGSIFWDKINVDYLKPDLSIKNAAGNIILKRLHLKNNVPDKIDAEINFNFDNFNTKTATLNGMQNKIHLYTSDETPDEQLMDFDLNLNEVKLSIEDRPPAIFPFKAHGSLVSNIAALDIKKLLVEWDLHQAATGKITATYLTSNDRRFTAQNTIDINIEKVKKYIPIANSKKIKELNLSGKFSSKINLAGKLDNHYLPEKVGFEITNYLENLNVNYPAYQIVLSDFNAKTSTHGQFTAEKGFELRVLELDGGFAKIKYSNNINIDKSSYSFAVNDIHSFSSKQPFGIKVNVVGKFKSKLAEILPLQAKLNQLSTNFSFNATTSKEKILNKIKLSGDVSIKNFRLSNKILSNNIKVAFDIDSPFLHSNRPRIDLNLLTHGIRFHYKEKINLKKNISAHILLLPDLQKKSISVKKMDINGLPLFRVSLKEGMFNIEKKFNIQELIFSLDSKYFWEIFSNFVKKEFPINNINGLIHINTSGEGTIPSITNIKEFKFPFKFNSNFNLDKVTIELDHPALKINKLNSQTNIYFDHNVVNLKGQTSIDSISNNQKMVLPEIHYQYDYELKNFKNLNIKKSILEIEKGFVSHSLEASIEGFNYMLAPNFSFSLLEVLEKIKFNLASRLVVKGGEGLFFSSPVQFTGGFNTNIFARLVPKEKFMLNGNIGFNNFVLKNSNIFIKNITGNIPISKSYILINNNHRIKQLKPSNRILSQSGFFSELRNYSSHKDLISIDSIQAGKQSLKQILIDLYLKDNLFAVEQFSFELGGGSVLGNLFLLPKKTGHILNLKLNFANIDLKQILKGVNKEGKNSTVNGNVKFTINISYGAKVASLSLGQIEMDLNITHIGEKALEQVLIFLDPNESNPSIADLKSKLKYAKPSYFNIRLKNERLSMYVQLKTPLTKTGLLNINVLNRVPVQRIKQFKLIKQNLKNISPFLKIIKLWTSNYIVLNKKQLIFR